MTRRKKAKAENEDWSWNSFMFGVFLGVPFYLSAVGYFGSSPLVRFLSQVLVFSSFIYGLYATVKFARKRKPVSSVGWDGFVTGFGFATTLLSFLLHGLFV
jgi:hypothetical protein